MCLSVAAEPDPEPGSSPEFQEALAAEKRGIAALGDSVDVVQAVGEASVWAASFWKDPAIEG